MLIYSWCVCNSDALQFVMVLYCVGLPVCVLVIVHTGYGYIGVVVSRQVPIADC